jgi:hypothetical protein
MKMAALNPRLHTLRKFGLMDFKVHRGAPLSGDQRAGYPVTFASAWIFRCGAGNHAGKPAFKLAFFLRHDR